MGDIEKQRPKGMTQVIERELVAALARAEPPIHPGQIKEVVANLRHSISSFADLGNNLEVILDERRRLWKLAKSAYNPNEWFSGGEIESMDEIELTTPPETIESKIVQRAIEHFYRRDGWEALLAISLDDESIIVPALSKTGYTTMTLGNPERILKRLAEKKGHDVVLATNYPQNETIDLYEKVREAFPDLPFLAIAKKDDSDYCALLTSKGIPYVFSDPLSRDELVIKLDQMVEDIARTYAHKAALEPKKGEVGAANNHIFTVMGPTCAGKSEMSSRTRKRMFGVALAKKSVTRGRRHLGEEDVEPHTLFRDPKSYFVTWKKGGVTAGLREVIFKPFGQGSDLLIPVSELDVLERIEGYVDDKYPDRKVLVPVMVMSDRDELWARFTQRGFSDDEDVEARKTRLDEEIELYRQNKHKFLSIVLNNSRYHTEQELTEDTKVEDLNVVVNRMQRIIQRLRQVPLQGYSFSQYHQKFVDDIIDSLFGYETFEDICIKMSNDGSDALTLGFEEEEMRQFVDEKQYPVDYMDYGKPRNVQVFNSNGRIVVAVPAYGLKKNGVDPDTDFFTGLIERRIGRAWKKQDTSVVSEGKTPYGLVKCEGAQFRGGVHFAITDRVPFEGQEHVYAVDVVYVSGCEDPSKIVPISADELTAMKKSGVDEINRTRSDIDLFSD